MSPDLDTTTAWLELLTPPIAPARRVEIAPYLQRMADGSGGKFLVTDIEERVADFRMQAWMIRIGMQIRAVFVTEIVVYPRQRALRFVGCVGTGWRDWVHMREVVRLYARQWGCDRMQLLAPAKWGIAFDDYDEWHVMYEREV